MGTRKGRRITIQEARQLALEARALVDRLDEEERAMERRLWDDGEAESLRELVRHCWVHSGYPDCGFRQMDGEMRDLYCKTIGRADSDREDK